MPQTQTRKVRVKRGREWETVTVQIRPTSPKPELLRRRAAEAKAPEVTPAKPKE